MDCFRPNTTSVRARTTSLSTAVVAAVITNGAAVCTENEASGKNGEMVIITSGGDGRTRAGGRGCRLASASVAS